jgi:hypothetical protein
MPVSLGENERRCVSEPSGSGWTRPRELPTSSAAMAVEQLAGLRGASAVKLASPDRQPRPQFCPRCPSALAVSDGHHFKWQVINLAAGSDHQ